MSEYQYYEFVATDRPLTTAEQRELRALSSRAEISATRFTNTYHYGDFRGDSAQVLERYFDAAVYVSSFGVRSLSFRLPRKAFDERSARPYLCEDVVTVKARGAHALIQLHWEDEDSDWVDEEFATSCLARLLPLRARLLRGDLGPLYVPWLHYANTSFRDEDDSSPVVEPPVPPGLRAGDEDLVALAEFFAIDRDLFDAAVEGSPEDPARDASPKALSAWIARLSTPSKDELLARVVQGEAAGVEGELRRLFAASWRAKGPAAKAMAQRSLDELLERAEHLRAERKEKQARGARREAAAKARALAMEQAKRVDALVGRTAQAWKEVEVLVQEQKADTYARAVDLLGDLRALAVREKDLPTFVASLQALQARHPKKAALHRRLRERGLDAEA